MSGKHDQIAGNLINGILSGQYRTGDRLPSERKLAAQCDANRNTVREAMKKLEQIGLAEIQLGGARVKDKSEASLDIIGHLLGQGDLPDPLLVDQIHIVVNALMSLAAEQLLESASDEAIDRIRDLAKPLFSDDAYNMDEETHMYAHHELMRSIMLNSGNLPLQLIARTLFEQISPNMTTLRSHMKVDRGLYQKFAYQLDQALAARDLPAVRTAFTAISQLFRETMMQAFEAAQSNLDQEAITT
ncbi:MAG: GntR family transcriptional regulator [Pseudomonadota bacterium]